MQIVGIRFLSGFLGTNRLIGTEGQWLNLTCVDVRAKRELCSLIANPFAPREILRKRKTCNANSSN